MNRILLFVLLLILSGCSRIGQQKESVLDQVRRTHIIRAATVIDPPMVIKNPATGEYSGHLVDAMKIIAERMNARVEWIETTYGNASATLQSGRCDIIVAPLFVNIERAQVVAFTQPVFYMGLSALVKRGSRFEKSADVYSFDQHRVTVALATGEAGDLFATSEFRKAELKRVNVGSADISRFMLEVTSGHADVAIADSNQIAKFVAVHSDVLDLFANKQFALSPASFAVRYGESDWLRFIDTSLHFLKTRGVLQKLEKKYGANWQHSLRE